MNHAAPPYAPPATLISLVRSPWSRFGWGVVPTWPGAQGWVPDEYFPRHSLAGRLSVALTAAVNDGARSIGFPPRSSTHSRWVVGLWIAFVHGRAA